MQPDVSRVMLDLIAQIRTTFPFDVPAAQICSGECRGCSLKLLDFLERDIEDWEHRLQAGERAGLADLSRLIRSSRRIGRVLARAQLMDLPERLR